MNYLSRDYEIRSAGGGDENTEPDPVAAVTELRTAVEQFRTSTDERLATELRKVTDRLDALDVRTQRPGGTQAPAEPGIERRAFTSFLRRGAERMPAEEARSLIVGDDTKGGYLAPAEFSTEVLKDIVEYSPVRQAARVGSTSSGSVILPKRTGTPTAHWVGETETRQETGSTYGQVEIPIHETAAYVDVSLQLLEDAAINVEAEVASDLAEEFGRLEGVAFVNGNGFKKPTGIMVDPNVPYSFTGNASTLGSAPADLLIDVFYSLQPFYRNRGAWMMNSTTLAAIRKLKDTEGNYLWRPGLTEGQPATILGRPVVEAVDMGDVGSAAEPIVFGDFNTAYRIYDRVAMSVLRDPYTVATSGLVRFHARRRLGGAVVRPAALRKIRCATS